MTALYGIALFVHSYTRWALLVTALVLLARTFAGWRGARSWERPDDLWHKSFVHLLNFQFGLGLVLYVFLSPITSAFFSSPMRMKDAVLRFFGVEHVFLMVLAIATAHIGVARSKKAETPALRHKSVWTWTLLGLVLMLAGIPWPFFPAARPLFRGLGAPAAAVSTSSTSSTAQPESCPPVYKSRCASCHGNAGRGDGVAAATLRPPPRDFATGAFASRSDAEIRAVIRDGGAAHGLSPLMAPNSDLGEPELGALVTCIRGFQGK